MVERLIAYRRHLRRLLAEGRMRIFSHELAALDAVTPAVVRRDLMTIGYAGSPARGYDVSGLVEKIGSLLNPSQDDGIALVGAGSLGRALLNHFGAAQPEFRVSALFDVAPERVGQVIEGFHCHHAADIEDMLRKRPAAVGIIAVPANVAQDVAERLVHAGVRGLLNFSPARLHVPPEVYVEDVDIAVSLEKVAFYSRREASVRET
jgi:redox-sensing transcriptional repressor